LLFLYKIIIKDNIFLCLLLNGVVVLFFQPNFIRVAIIGINFFMFSGKVYVLPYLVTRKKNHYPKIRCLTGVQNPWVNKTIKLQQSCHGCEKNNHILTLLH
jgi:hypothetical protein